MRSATLALINTLAGDEFDNLPENTLYGMTKLLSRLGSLKIETTLLLTRSERRKYRGKKPLKLEAEEPYWVIKAVLEEYGLTWEKVENFLDKYGDYIRTYRDRDDYSTYYYNADTSLELIIRDALQAIPKTELKLMTDWTEREKILKFFAGLKRKPEKKTEKFYSDAFDRYLSNLRLLITTGVDMGIPEYLWSQSLLLSIDDDCEQTAFAQSIAREFIGGGTTAKLNSSSLVSELRVPNNCEKKEKYDPWKSLLGSIDKGDKDGNRLNQVLIVDLSEWANELSDSAVQKNLQQVQNRKHNCFIIFRVPYMERRALKQIEDSLSRTTTLTTLIVPPLSTAKMIEYLSDKLKEKGYRLNKSCHEELEQLLLEEKNSRNTLGFSTMDVLLDKILFEKISRNAIEGVTDKRIDRKVIASIRGTSSTFQTTAELLDSLIGVEEIKKQIEDAIRQIQAHQKMRQASGTVKRPAIHMMFTGNPGTGKTTIARLAASMMKDAGILSKGYLNEIKGRDLCGSYIGETTPKTVGYCRDSYGSVLFIDEAYQLAYSDSPRDYGSEAIAALIAEMENHRDDMCVILAGYSDEMEKMLEKNAGLKDRIPIRIDFPNYSREQLWEIFMKMVEDSFEYDEALRDTSKKFFMNLPSGIIDAKDFSNARFVRNIFERTWGEASLRYDLNDCGQIYITEADFNAAIVKLKLDTPAKEHHFGFAC